MKKAKYLIVKTLIFVVLMLTFLSCYLLVNKIFMPAYYSTISDCTSKGEETSQQAGYYTAGKIVIQPTQYVNDIPIFASNSNYSIEIVNESQHTDDINQMILKHENCHLKQLQDNRVKSCNDKNGKLYRFLLESECYIKQYM